MGATSGCPVTSATNFARFNLQGILPIVNTLLAVQNVSVEDSHTRGQGVESVHSAITNICSRSLLPYSHVRVSVPQGQGKEDSSLYDGSRASYESYAMEDIGGVPHDQARINRWLGSHADGMNGKMISVLADI